MAGHQRDGAILEPAIGDADGIAGQALQHLQAGERVGGLDPHRAPDEVERWNELRHGALLELQAVAPRSIYSMPI